MAQSSLPRYSLGRRAIRIVWLAVLLLLVCGAALLGPARRAAAQDERCFEAEEPGITACLSGRFRAFWESNGGVAVFGYPLTDAAERTTADGVYTTQYFERARFELHPDNAPPYDVLLGRLGADSLAALGVDWAALAEDAPADGCLYWAETGHTVCGAFLEAWRSRGLRLDDDPAITDAEALALWGLPLTPVQTGTGANAGVRVQWFERARFEEQPDGTITFGRLGAELQTPSAPATPEPVAGPAEPTTAPAEPIAAPAPPTATPQPAPPSVPFPSVPCNRNVPVPAEGLQLWVVDPAPRRPADAVACVRLIVDGSAARGASAIVYRYRGAERRPSIPQSTGGDGVASFIFYIGEEAGGARIPLEALVTYNGVTYTAYSEFTPQ